LAAAGHNAVDEIASARRGWDVTEEEWLCGDYPEAMIVQINEVSRARRLRLLYAALLARISSNYQVDASPEETLEELAEGRVPRREFAARLNCFRAAVSRHDRIIAGESSTYMTHKFRQLCGMTIARDPSGFACHIIDGFVGLETRWAIVKPPGLGIEEHAGVRAATSRGMAALFRDIFGNPFRPVAFDPRWRTSDAVALPQAIYDERAFERLPILGDARWTPGARRSRSSRTAAAKAHTSAAAGSWT
jgi:hypothetical protein